MGLTLSSLPYTEAEVDEARRFNAGLALLPRIRPNDWTVDVAMGLLTASQVGSNSRLQSAGISVETRRIEHDGRQVDLRILRPTAPPRAVLIDIHGGGWAFGNACMDDKANARLIAACGIAVVAVDYRRLNTRRGVTIAEQVEDCVAASEWLIRRAVAEFGTNVLFIAGESAGAHLAALTLLSLRQRRQTISIAGAVMLYGVYDLDGTPSVRAAGRHTLLLNGPTMLADLRSLAEASDDPRLSAPRASPLRADLSGLPSALLVVGDIDPLLDDTCMMAERWAQAAAVELLLAPESPHGFTQFPGGLASRTNARVQGWVTETIDRADSVDNPNP